MTIPVPVTITSNVVTANSVTIYWSAQSDVDGFRIERKTASTSYIVVGTVGKTATSFTNSGVASETEYQYRITGFNKCGFSDPSFVTATTSCQTPDPVFSLSAAPKPGFDTVIVVTWNHTGGGYTYTVQSSADGVTYSNIATGLTDTHYDHNTTSSSCWYYKVTAQRCNSSSIPVHTTSLVCANCTAPSVPLSVSTVPLGSDGITFSWSAPSSGVVQNYHIEKYNGSWNNFATVASNVFNVNDTGLAASTPYCYRVSATNSCGSGPSAQSCITLVPNTCNCCFSSTSQVVVSWNILSTGTACYCSNTAFKSATITCNKMANECQWAGTGGTCSIGGVTYTLRVVVTYSANVWTAEIQANGNNNSDILVYTFSVDGDCCGSNTDNFVISTNVCGTINDAIGQMQVINNTLCLDLNNGCVNGVGDCNGNCPGLSSSSSSGPVNSSSSSSGGTPICSYQFSTGRIYQTTPVYTSPIFETDISGVAYLRFHAASDDIALMIGADDSVLHTGNTFTFPNDYILFANSSGYFCCGPEKTYTDGTLTHIVPENCSVTDDNCRVEGFTNDGFIVTNWSGPIAISDLIAKGWVSGGRLKIKFILIPCGAGNIHMNSIECFSEYPTVPICVSGNQCLLCEDYAPTEITATFQGVQNSACYNCNFHGYQSFSTTGTFSGTYCLSQAYFNSSSSNNGMCSWETTIANPLTIIGYSGPNCTGTPTALTGDVKIQIERRSGSLTYVTATTTDGLRIFYARDNVYGCALQTVLYQPLSYPCDLTKPTLTKSGLVYFEPCCSHECENPTDCPECCCTYTFVISSGELAGTYTLKRYADDCYWSDGNFSNGLIFTTLGGTPVWKLTLSNDSFVAEWTSLCSDCPPSVSGDWNCIDYNTTATPTFTVSTTNCSTDPCPSSSSSSSPVGACNIIVTKDRNNTPGGHYGVNISSAFASASSVPFYLDFQSYDAPDSLSVHSGSETGPIIYTTGCVGTRTVQTHKMTLTAADSPLWINVDTGCSDGEASSWYWQLSCRPRSSSSSGLTSCSDDCDTCCTVYSLTVSDCPILNGSYSMTQSTASACSWSGNGTSSGTSASIICIGGQWQLQIYHKNCVYYFRATQTGNPCPPLTGWTYFSRAKGSCPATPNLVFSKTGCSSSIMTVEYIWNNERPNMDMRVNFPNTSTNVGSLCSGNSTPYISYSGNDATYGGMETVAIDLGSALSAGIWTNSITMPISACWNQSSNLPNSAISPDTNRSSPAGSWSYTITVTWNGVVKTYTGWTTHLNTTCCDNIVCQIVANSNGTYSLTCEDQCSVGGCLGSQAPLGSGSSSALVLIEENAGNGSELQIRRRCHRLYVYKEAYHDGTRFHVDSGKLTSVRTDGKILYNAYSGPFYADHQVANKANSPLGTLLNYQPYWFTGCGGTGIGGWKITKHWFNPTNTNLTDIYNQMNTSMSLPAAGVKFTLILYLRFTRTNNIETNSTVRFLGGHITCPTTGIHINNPACPENTNACCPTYDITISNGGTLNGTYLPVKYSNSWFGQNPPPNFLQLSDIYASIHCGTRYYNYNTNQFIELGGNFWFLSIVAEYQDSIRQGAFWATPNANGCPAQSDVGAWTLLCTYDSPSPDYTLPPLPESPMLSISCYNYSSSSSSSSSSSVFSSTCEYVFRFNDDSCFGAPATITVHEIAPKLWQGTNGGYGTVQLREHLGNWELTNNFDGYENDNFIYWTTARSGQDVPPTNVSLWQTTSGYCVEELLQIEHNGCSESSYVNYLDVNGSNGAWVGNNYNCLGSVRAHNTPNCNIVMSSAEQIFDFTTKTITSVPSIAIWFFPANVGINGPSFSISLDGTTYSNFVTTGGDISDAWVRLDFAGPFNQSQISALKVKITWTGSGFTAGASYLKGLYIVL